MIAENSGSSRIASKSGSVSGVLLESLLGLHALAEMLQRRVLPARGGSRRTREVVEEAGVAGAFVKELLVRLGGLVVVLVREVDEPLRVPLPRRRR